MERLSLAEGRLYPRGSRWEWRLTLMENPFFIHCFLPGGAETLICALSCAQAAGSWCKPAGAPRIPVPTCRSSLDTSRALQEQQFPTLHTAHSKITALLESKLAFFFLFSWVNHCFESMCCKTNDLILGFKN